MKVHGDPCDRGGDGFTLIELLVVMGILTGFLVMLVQLVDSGLRIFAEGELGQALADRGNRAQRVVGEELSRLRADPHTAVGPEADSGPTDRLVVQLLPLGLPPQPERDPVRVPVLRGAVSLAPERELALVDALLLGRVMQEDPGAADDAIERRVAALRGSEPLRGVGNLLLLPWRQDDTDDALLELRAGWLLPGQVLPVGRDRFVDPFAVPVPGGPDLPGLLVHAVTTPVLRDLLHFELRLWGQATTSWGEERTSAAPGSGAALLCWDSTRGGWLLDARSGGPFPLDRGPASEADPSDDVHPHAILVRIVVALPAEAAPEGMLAAALDAADTALQLYDGNRFPGRADGGFVKIGGEWLRYAARSGDRLTGLVRGQRHTRAGDHPAGARVHVGRRVEFVVPILHHKDDWNG